MKNIARLITAFTACMLAVSIYAQGYSWQKAHAKVLPSGDLQWEPQPFVYVTGPSVRYIDFEGGNDANDGLTPATAWKHHPWDANATGNALACSGIQTYVFKRGVVYRGSLTAKESGTASNPIRLTSDPSWGSGEAAIYGSLRITGGWTQANSSSAPNIPNPEKVWYKDLSSSLPWTKVVCEINGNEVRRLPLARIPNWVVADTADPLAQCWEWTGPSTPGNEAGYRIDNKHLTQTDPNYWNGTTIWSQYAGMMGTLWGEPIVSYDPATHKIVTQYNYGQANDRYFIENSPRLLDTTNEYYFAKTGSFPGRLYLRLDGDRNPNTTTIEVATQETPLLTINNQHDIVISGLTFGFTTSTAMRWGATDQMQACAIYISGTTSNLTISNCHFMYLNNVISAGGNCSFIYITDNLIERVDDQAITFSPGGQKNIYILRNRLFDISGRTNSRWYSPLCAITGTFQHAEIAGNVLEMCWGSAIDIFWSNGSYVRGMVHHNKVNWGLLATCDWGALESWNTGPAYYFNNVSKNPRGYINGLGRSWGMAYYLDGGASSQYLFNNIAIGTGNDVTNEKKSSGVAYEQTTGSCNVFANNTAHKFYYSSYSQNSMGNNFYLGNVYNDISKKYFMHETGSAELPFQSISNNCFYTQLYKPWMGNFTPNNDLYSLEEFQQGCVNFKMRASQVGWKSVQPLLQNPDAGDLRPVAGGEATDRGVKVFIPFSLANECGIWNFYRHPADSSLIAGENYYYGTQRLNLKAYNVTSASYIKGNLEDWTEGALDFNGTGTYCSTTNTSLDMTTNNFIIEAYFRTLKGSTGRTLVSKYNGSGNGFILDISSGGQARMRIMTGGSDAANRSTATAVNDGNWHHLLAEVIRNSGTINLYLDGNLSNGTFTGSMPAAGTSLSNTAPFYVGRDNSGNYFAGTFDFLRVSKGSLADAETTYDELYTWEFNGPFLKDFAGNVPAGTRDAGALENGKSDGEGLKGEYFDNSNFTSPVKTIIDPTINFSWGNNAPDASMGANQYSVRWTGQILPEYSEEYTFEVEHADGVRLWVNGRLLIDQWTDGSGIHSESIKLLAHQKYDIKLEYYKNTSPAKIILKWQSASQAKEIVPQKNLYPPCIVEITTDKINLGYDSSATQIAVKNTYALSASSEQKWLFVSVSNGTIQVSASCNTSKYSRTGKIYLYGCSTKTIAVTQEGNPGIDIKPAQMNAVSFYPNPVSETLSIETPEIDLSNPVWIKITDMEGRLIKISMMKPGVTTIPVSSLSPGMYLIRIEAREGIMTGRFIKL